MRFTAPWKIFRLEGALRPQWHEWAFKESARRLGVTVSRGARVLDVGCGSGFTGAAIMRVTGAHVIGIDVQDARKTELPFVLYDGKKIPFGDNEFDFVLIFFVLHHLANPEIVLEEAKRVCGAYIVVAEDTPKNILHKISCWFHVYSYPFWHGVGKGGRFMSEQEWERLFNSRGLTVLKRAKVPAFDPRHITERTVFLLHKNQKP